MRRQCCAMLYGVLRNQTLYQQKIPLFVAASSCTRGVIMARFQSTSSSPDVAEVKGHARKIFDAGVEAVMPDRMVKNCLKFNGNELTVKDKSYAVDHNVHVVGFGKAVIGMVKAIDDILGDHVINGVASVPCGLQEILRTTGRENLLPEQNSKVKIMEGAKNNLPDAHALRAANQIAEIAGNLTEKDILIVLVSGGGSALLPCPVPPISLEEKEQVTKALAMKGATISELNTVRKNLSTLKGGGLAQLAYPAQVVSLILSDIIGDPLDLIASAPTVADQSTPNDCLDIIQRLEIKDEIPKSVIKYLTEKSEGKLHEGQKSDLDHVTNIIVGSNTIAVEHALKEAERCGYVATSHSMSVSGEAKVIGKMYSSLAAYVYELYCVNVSSSNQGESGSKIDMGSKSAQMQYQQLLNLLLRTQYSVTDIALKMIEVCVQKAADKRQPVCIIGAGETTVTVTGDGKGGRNQELALSAALGMNESPIFQHLKQQGFELVLLSAGTDGQDGPTDATGSFAYPGQVTDVNQSDTKNCLDRNDSYSFYKGVNRGEDLIVTGLTGTNVMDMQILLLNPPK
ncbi:glycerate kinase-like [Amphiura filiformis]|uniref:glycerate kinase-like n=1 Tax=Amphiura filiformis TaxID=82378 RepID=UPI003B216ABC